MNQWTSLTAWVLVLGYGVLAMGQDQRRPPDAPVATIKVGEFAPELDVISWIDGNDYSLATLRGKVVLLDFWYEGCGPCIVGMAALRQLRDKYRKQPFTLLSIHLAGGEFSTIRNSLGHYPKMLVGIDRGTAKEDSKTARAYGVTAYPCYVVIGKDGRVVFNSELVVRDPNNYRQWFTEILDEKGIRQDEPTTSREAATRMNKFWFAVLKTQIDKALASDPDHK